MNEMFNFTTDEKIDIFDKVAKIMEVPSVAVEKDFWVTWVLGKIFADEELSKMLMFKGGTSLSKVFHLIGRFSEDIDLILDWRLIANQESFKEELSKNKQSKFNEQINEDGKKYIKNELLDMLNNTLAPLCQYVIGEDENCIMVQYPNLYADNYIKTEIALEIGPLASWLPSNTYTVSSFVAEQFPNLFENLSYEVKAIEPTRTFWEKATILHQEANRPQDKPLPKRYARHYYDLAIMAKNDEFKDKVLSDLSLLENVIKFKQKYYPTGWAKYEEIFTNGLKLLPQDCRLEELEEDYLTMQKMIFDKRLEFSQIIDILGNLEQEIALKMNHTHKPKGPRR